MDAGDRLGTYRILEPLGTGGMGEVYRAEDTRLKRQVAIKVLPEALAADAQRLGRLEREAQLLASLNHPNIAAIYGLQEVGGSRALVLELVEGPTLEGRLASAAPLPHEDRPAGACGMPLEEAACIALQIAEALEAAHERGVVHRDLKPANVKVAEGEGGMPIVKVLDFGLAKSTAPAVDVSGSAGTRGPDAPADSPTLSLEATQAGLVLGTAAYMSPEQAKGKPADRRADIWSFGAVLYEMIAGRRLFDGDTVSEVLAAVILQEVDWAALPTDTPPALRALLRRCLTRDPRRRLRDIGEARLALEDYLADPRASTSGLVSGGAALGESGAGADVHPGSGSGAEVHGGSGSSEAALHGSGAGGTSASGATAAADDPEAARLAAAKRRLDQAGEIVARAGEINAQKAAARQKLREQRAGVIVDGLVGWGRLAAAFALGLAAFYVIGTLWPGRETAAVTRLVVRLIDAVDTDDESAVQPSLELTAGPPFALSPDGRRLAYITTAAGEASKLWVRDLDRLESRLLAEGELLHPFFSPDGEWIGFFSGTEMRKVAVAGGSSTRLAEVELLNRGASWGDDGYIVYSPGVTHPIFRVPETGGVGEAITELDATAGPSGHRFPDVLPGGRVVLYTSGIPGNFASAVIRAIDLDSGRDVEVIGGIYGRYLRTGHLAYVVEGTLFVQPFDETSLAVHGRPVPAVPRLAFSLGNASAQYAVSASGSLMYLVGDRATVRNQPIFRVPIDAGEERSAVAPEANYLSPRVSPDGARLAYAIGDTARSDLHVRERTGAESRITFDTTGNGNPVWSPDGRYIYFRALRQGAPDVPFGETIWRKRADGVGEEEQITFGSSDAPRDFAPDGSALLMKRVVGTTAIDLMVLRFEDGEPVGEPQPFVSGPVRDDFGRFSPDGRWVAYHSTENGGRLDVFVTPYPAANAKFQISTDGGSFPVWAPDGSTIYYQGNGEILAVDVRAEGEALVREAPRSIVRGNYTSSRVDFSNWDIDPSGEFFYIINQPLQTGGDEAPVLVMNWFEEVKAFPR